MRKLFDGIKILKDNKIKYGFSLKNVEFLVGIIYPW